MAMKKQQGLNSFANDEYDAEEYRKRVATYVDGTSVSYEDTSFLVADSPAVLDVFTDLGRIGHEGYIMNDGDGNFSIEISANGSTYGGVHTIKANEELVLSGLKIKRIRITRITDSSYRVFIA